MIWGNFFKRGFTIGAFFAFHVAPFLESTLIGQIDRRDNFPLKNNTLTLTIDVGHRNCREQCFCVGMDGVAEEFLCGCLFYESAEVHDCDIV